MSALLMFQAGARDHGIYSRPFHRLWDKLRSALPEWHQTVCVRLQERHCEAMIEVADESFLAGYYAGIAAVKLQKDRG